MSAAAQREDRTEGSAAELRQLAAERLLAHRSRRAQTEAREAEAQSLAQRRRESAANGNARGASRVREAVAARYEQSQSYREFLAAEAERALEQAQAEAEVAARSARAVADVQLQLLAELEQWTQSEPLPREQAMAAGRREARGELAHALADIVLGATELIAEPPLLTVVDAGPRIVVPPQAPTAAEPAAQVLTGGLQVRLYEDLGSARPPEIVPQVAQRRSPARDPEHARELENLEQEIEWRLAPEFEDAVTETVPIHGNLIEFPRELVAPRKARPRIAEGPLREEAGPSAPQLRIFEVEPEQIAAQPAMEEWTSAPDWQSLHLSSVVREPHSADPAHLAFSAELHPASLGRRALAVGVDAGCLGTAFAGAAAVAWKVTGPTLHAVPVAVGGATAAAVGLILLVGYHLLFFSLGEATPGMRVARLGLCTFADGHPSRQAMRRRLLATLLAASPLGLGFVWAVLDTDRLGWHDRLSRMYLREVSPDK